MSDEVTLQTEVLFARNVESERGKLVAHELWRVHAWDSFHLIVKRTQKNGDEWEGDTILCTHYRPWMADADPRGLLELILRVHEDSTKIFQQRARHSIHGILVDATAEMEDKIMAEVKRWTR